MATTHQGVPVKPVVEAPVVEAPVVEAPVVEAPLEEPAAPAPVSERDQVMAGLARKRREQLRGEGLEIEEPGDAVATSPVTETSTPDPDELIPLKVNGQIMVRPRSEVDAAGGVAAIQKQISGDMKLAEAAAERRRLDEEKQAIARERAHLNEEKQALATARQQEVNDAEIDQKAKALAEGILLGDEDRVIETVKLVLAKPVTAAPATPAPVIPIEQITETAVKRARFELEKDLGNQEFHEKFKDLAADPSLRNQVNELTKTLQVQYPTWGPRQVILKAAELTRVLNPKPVTPVDPNSLADKAQRKASAPTPLPRAAARAPGVPEHQPKTPAQIFDEIRAGRSQ